MKKASTTTVKKKQTKTVPVITEEVVQSTITAAPKLSVKEAVKQGKITAKVGLSQLLDRAEKSKTVSQFKRTSTYQWLKARQ